MRLVLALQAGMLRYRAKNLFLALERRVNRSRLARKKEKGSRGSSLSGFLAYHSICRKERIPACLQGEVVREADFSAQLDQLLQSGFRFLSLEEWMSRLQPPRTVVLTFDDGYSGIFHQVFPLLEKYRIPATIFLTTGFLNNQVRPPWDSPSRELQRAFHRTSSLWQPLQWGQVREMATTGRIEFGSHGCSHRRLGRLPAAEVKRELLLSREEIERQTGRPVRTFSYPFGVGRYGAYRSDLEKELREAGYMAACTGEEGRPAAQTNPFFLPRFPVRLGDTGTDLEGRLAGLSDWTSRCQHIFHRLFTGSHGD